jgi:hypothetical protein
MKLLSPQELAFLNNPDRFSGGYQKVLRCRIKKKARAMQMTLQIIQYSWKAMRPKRRRQTWPITMLN